MRFVVFKIFSKNFGNYEEDRYIEECDFLKKNHHKNLPNLICNGQNDQNDLVQVIEFIEGI